MMIESPEREEEIGTKREEETGESKDLEESMWPLVGKREEEREEREESSMVVQDVVMVMQASREGKREKLQEKCNP